MRDLLAARPAGDASAARTLLTDADNDIDDAVDNAVDDAVDDADEIDDATPGRAWLPGADFERHVPGREVAGSSAGAAWRDRLRWDPGRRGAVALGVLLVAAVAATGWWLAAARPHEVPISGPATAPGSATIASSPVSAGSSLMPPASVSPSGGVLVVDVAGKVRRPGIYELKAGARVYDAVRAAGGVRAGVSTVSLNLAEPLHDGEQIVVGIAGGGVPGPAGSAGSSGAATVVPLNTATLEQLETLPGVGPVLGQHILDWRDAHGRFTSIDQLREVSGIGDVRFAQLRPLVSL